MGIHNRVSRTPFCEATSRLFMNRTSSQLAVLAALAVTLFALPVSKADKQNLGDLDTHLAEDKNKKKNRRSYVGVFGGNTQSQSAKVTLEGNPFDLRESDSDFLMGFEVGYIWKLKRYPFEVGVEFEGSFLSTELNGSFGGSLTDPVPRPLTGSSIVDFHTDMNAAIFSLNGHIALDLYRYRARLGNWVTRLRPYIGGGLGGAQLWFRNTTTTTLDGVSMAGTTPFSTDEFVFAYNYFAGIEYAVNEKVSIYAEYRHLGLEDFDSKTVQDFETSSWVGGVRIHYDKKKPKE